MNARIARWVSKAALVAGVGGVIAASAMTLAAPPRPGSGCPRRGIYCLDVYNPVDCTDRFGVVRTYSNSCYAYVACATGCTPGGTR
jgi:hypothetical protein